MHQVSVTKTEHMLDNFITTSILRLKKYNIQLMIKENQQQIKNAEAEKNEEEVETLLKIHAQLKEAEKLVSGFLGTVIGK